MIAPRGGTELLHGNLMRHIPPEKWDGINLMISACDSRFVDPNKFNVMWQHLSYDQANVANMNDRNFVDSIDHFVYVSEWQFDKFRYYFNLSDSNNTIIRNAIDPIEYVEKPKDRIRLIYTSTPNRGLQILLDALDIMGRKDIEVVVFSSDIIYGKGYADMMRGRHDNLFNRCKKSPIITYMGYATNKAVRRALQKAHILAYPSIYEETSCLAAIEAGAAGCQIVTTEYGALPETCQGWATFVSHDTNYRNLAESYAHTLNTAIDSWIEDGKETQSDWFNSKYSWHRRIPEWNDFLKKVRV